MELIITTTVVAIVMLGVMSADYAIRSSADSSAKSTKAVLEGEALNAHIIQNAIKMTGTRSDPGFVFGLPGNSFCLRTDMAPSWVCYTTTAAVLYTCIKADNVPSTACSAADTGYASLGQVFNDTAVVPSFDPDDPDQAYFSIQVDVSDRSKAAGYRRVTASISPPAYSY